MLLEELFNNDAKVLEVLSKLTPEDIGEYVAESVLLEELCQEGFSDLNLFKGGRTVQGDDSASKGDSAGDSALATAGDLAKTIATGGSATANLAAARAARLGYQKNRGKTWLDKSTSSSAPTSEKELKKQVKIDAKATGADIAKDAKDKTSNVRKDISKKNAIKSASGDAERSARSAARKKIDDFNKANPAKKITGKEAEKIVKKAGSLATKIAARHGAATLLGGGITPLSWLLNIGALGWDAYDIANWYLNNKK
jgi:hypothetical protein